MASTENSDRDGAHRDAKERDARTQYNVGDTLTVVLEEDPEMNNGREGVARTEGLVVFVTPGEIPVEPGAHLTVCVSDVQKHHLRGVAVQRYDL